MLVIGERQVTGGNGRNLPGQEGWISSEYQYCKATDAGPSGAGLGGADTESSKQEESCTGAAVLTLACR